MAGLLAAELVVRVKFEALTLKDAERQNGKAVVTTFTVGAPAYTWGEGKKLRTIVAPADCGGAGRTVVLKGDRTHDAHQGAKVTVVGTLRVIRHAPSMLGTMPQGARTEIRIEE